MQYADFTLWERNLLNEEVQSKQLSYWHKKLVDVPTEINFLPVEQPQINTTQTRVASYSIVLPENLVTAIQTLSRSQGISTFVIILTALKILLFKWSGKTDILVAATIGNRSMPEIEQMLGCFINDVILHSQVGSSQTSIALLEQVKQTLCEAISNKDVPFQEIIETFKNSGKSLPISASITMNPPIQGNKGFLEYEVVPLTIEPEFWHEQIPLDFFISSPTEDYKEIQIELYYNTALFTNETIENLFSNYQEIMQKLVAQPEVRLSEFYCSK